MEGLKRQVRLLKGREGRSIEHKCQLQQGDRRAEE